MTAQVFLSQADGSSDVGISKFLPASTGRDL